MTTTRRAGRFYTMVACLSGAECLCDVCKNKNVKTLYLKKKKKKKKKKKNSRGTFPVLSRIVPSRKPGEEGNMDPAVAKNDGLKGEPTPQKMTPVRFVSHEGCPT